MYKEGLISVIIPIYNVEDYLGRCLDSVLGNTYGHLEVICVNDGSTDSCLEILERYEKLDSRIVIIDKKNGGISSARNCGRRAATGEFIAFVDSDDWVAPYYFEYLLRAITEYEADMSMCGFVRTKDDAPFEKKEYSADVISVKKMITVHRYQSYVWRRLFRHEIIEDLYFDENEKIEDADYLSKILAKLPDLKIVNTDAVLYAYYNRKGSLVTNIKQEDFLLLSEKQLQYAGMTGSKKIKKLLAERAIRRSLSARFAFIALGDKRKIKECNDIIKHGLMLSFSLGNLLLYLFPRVYRRAMIIIDPTMKTYEKHLKERSRNSSI